MSTRFINSTTQLCQSFWHVAHDERPKRENNGAIAYQSTELGSISVVKTSTQTSSEQLVLAQSRVHQSSSLSIRSTHGKTSQDAARTHHRLLRHDSRRHTSLPANATVERCRHEERDAENTEDTATDLVESGDHDTWKPAPSRQYRLRGERAASEDMACATRRGLNAILAGTWHIFELHKSLQFYSWLGVYALQERQSMVIQYGKTLRAWLHLMKPGTANWMTID